MNASTTNNVAAKATETPSATATAATTTATTASTGETKSSAPSLTKVSARFPQTMSSLPSQAVVHPVPSLRSSSVQLEFQWIPVQVKTSEETWIFVHPIDKNHQVYVRALPTSEMPSSLIQSELISLEYKKKHGMSRIRTGSVLQHWLRIYSYLQPSFPQRIGMRRLCRLFNAVERLTTENPRRSKFMLKPIPSGVWTTVLHVNHDHQRAGSLHCRDPVETAEKAVRTAEAACQAAQEKLKAAREKLSSALEVREESQRQSRVATGTLVRWINGVVEASPDHAPQLLFLQESAPDEKDIRRDYKSLSGACVVVDEMGCFHFTGENVTDNNVVRVARERPNLQTLNLRVCVNITDTSLLAVARGCLNLQSLDLGGCGNITDASVSKVARQCSYLQTLNLGGCVNISDASVLEIARGCLNLQSLNLTYCKNITDTSLLEVGRQCSNLQSLNLADCSNISDASVLEIARGCLNLQSLNLSCFRSNITDASVLEVGRRCSNLQSLNLRGCSNITDASVMEVARGCSNLQTLILGGCSNITSACKNALRQKQFNVCKITSACKKKKNKN